MRAAFGTPRPGRGRVAANLLLGVGSVLFFVAVAEIAVRASGYVGRHVVPASTPREADAAVPWHPPGEGKGKAKVRYRVMAGGDPGGGPAKREAPPDAAGPVGVDFIQYEPEASWELLPNFHGKLGDITIDAQGLRGPGLPSPRPPGERWVLLMGDSVTFGWGVGQQDTYGAQLEASSRDCGGRRLRVLDAGVPGYAISQGEVALERRLALAPDDVVLCFGNVDRLILEGRAGRIDAPVSLAALRPIHQLLRRSHAYLALRYTLLAASARVRGSRPPDREAQLAAYRERLAGMVRRAAGEGREVILLAQPHESDGNRPFNDVARAVAAESGARFVDVPAPFHDPARRRELLLSECHPTPEGHRLIADALASALGCR